MHLFSVEGSNFPVAALNRPGPMLSSAYKAFILDTVLSLAAEGAVFVRRVISCARACRCNVTLASDHFEFVRF